MVCRGFIPADVTGERVERERVGRLLMCPRGLRARGREAARAPVRAAGALPLLEPPLRVPHFLPPNPHCAQGAVVEPS